MKAGIMKALMRDMKRHVERKRAGGEEVREVSRVRGAPRCAVSVSGCFIIVY